MISTPNGKINLGLHVVSRREDGYHNLETIFLPVPICDTLTAEPANELSFRLEGNDLDCDMEHNLCVKAYRLLKKEYPHMGSVKIVLEKKIPTGAGMGGGSADAAFMLKMLNGLFSLGIGNSQLERYAARLGADCAFFVENRPAYATGIGDVMEPIDLSGLNGYNFVFVKPPDTVSTAEAYRSILPRNKRENDPRIDLREAVKRPLSEWKEYIVNDFEEHVFPAHPAIAHCKQELYEAGALYASMTGSGAAVFGIFPPGTAYRPLPKPCYYTGSCVIRL